MATSKQERGVIELKAGGFYLSGHLQSFELPNGTARCVKPLDEGQQECVWLL